MVGIEKTIGFSWFPGGRDIPPLHGSQEEGPHEEMPEAVPGR